MTNPPSSYEGWTREQLIARLTELDPPRVTHPHPKSTSPRPLKSFSFSSYPRRKIALRFCYSGWEYNGLAHQLGPTPLPTVEGVLFEALGHARLVDPDAGFDGCEFERCGRTDRGVSAAGQVVSLWVRSALGGDFENNDCHGHLADVQQPDPCPSEDAEAPGLEGDLGSIADLDMEPSTPPSIHRKPSELHYVSILNRLLPPTIRILAWSPVSPNFSARFACKYRHYKYFFSSHGLDLSLMRDGATRLLGEHDFRNFCKLDPAKQITNFKRCILCADISPVEGGKEGKHAMYVFDLVGTAFLYHQVRHIMAVLFLVGTGLDHPSVVSSLLNVEAGLEQPRNGDPPVEVVDCKPDYQMADGLPLMLWDCAYAESDVQWQTDSVEEPDGMEAFQSGSGTNLYHEMDSILERSMTHTILDAHFLAAASRYHLPPKDQFPLNATGYSPGTMSDIMNVPLGGGTFRRTATYVPLLKRKRLDSVDVANKRWRLGKGFRREGRRKADAQGDADDGDK